MTMDIPMSQYISQDDGDDELLSLAEELREADESNWRDVLQDIIDQYGGQSAIEEEPLTPQRKDQLLRDITLFLVKSVREGAISFDEMSDIGSYVLSWYDRLFTPSDVGDFLYLLKSRWSFFESFARIEEINHLPPHEQIAALAEGIKE